MLPAITGRIEGFIIRINSHDPGMVHVQKFTIGHIERYTGSRPCLTAIMSSIEQCPPHVLRSRTAGEDRKKAFLLGEKFWRPQEKRLRRKGDRDLVPRGTGIVCHIQPGKSGKTFII